MTDRPSRKDAPRPSESTIQKKILKYLGRQPHCWSVKVIMTNANGCPDILCCCKGRFVGIECKRPGGKLSRLQEHHINEIRRAGGTAIVAQCVEDVKEVIDGKKYTGGFFNG